MILSPGLKIEKVYVGYWFWGRPSVYQLWADLQEIHQRIKADYDPTTPAARAAWEAAAVRRRGVKRPPPCNKTHDARTACPQRGATRQTSSPGLP